MFFSREVRRVMIGNAVLASRVPIADQQAFWADWNARYRAKGLSQRALDLRNAVVGRLEALGRRNLDILEVGCGSGWLCPTLARYGRVTGTDIVSDLLRDAQARQPAARFIAGDFMQLPFEEGAYDVVVSLEVLSHVADQDAFVAKIGRLLRPGGLLILATQNRPVLERFNRVPPPAPNQLRRWVDRRELASLVEGVFEIENLHSVTPQANRGLMRLLNLPVLHRAPVLGPLYKRLKERMWLGWNLVCVARRRAANDRSVVAAASVRISTC